ncbi:tetratricopeptide repeat protein [bacterium]|nr:MAG: tetratricopeptide repeat protein [bacterium]
MGAGKNTVRRAKRLSKLVCLFAALLLAGCAANLSYLKNSSLPERAGIPDLVPFEQKEHLCGPSALATLLRWAGEPEITPDFLCPLLYTPGKEGTFLFDIAREIRLRGYLAYSLTGGLREVLEEIASGKPVLVLENRGLSFYTVYHYSVAGGYDLGRGEILLYEGKREARLNSLSTFSRTFERSGEVAVLALPPGELPVSAPPTALLEALGALESAGKKPEARRGYENFTKRFPGSWLGHFALGNSLAGSGDFAGAKGEFEIALGLSPDRPEILNNLALIASGEGRCAEAERLAGEAVEKARGQGMDGAPYEETAREVLRCGK